MDLIAILFVVALLIPGLYLILIIGREFKRREWFTHERRIEQELAELAARRAALRRISRRSAASPTGSTIAPLAYESGSAAAPVRADEAVNQDSRSAQGDSWQDLTASHIGAAFESFLSAIPQPRSNVITTSQVDEAFEKFMVEMQHRDGLPA